MKACRSVGLTGALLAGWGFLQALPFQPRRISCSISTKWGASLRIPDCLSSTTSLAASTTSTFPTIDFSIVAYSGLRKEELDMVQAAIESACAQDLGLVVSVSNINHPTSVSQEAPCATSCIPGALGRVLLLQTNLDVDSIETVEYAISAQMDGLLYSDPPLLTQPILTKIHNPQFSNLDFDDISMNTLQLIVEDEVNIYQLNKAVDDDGNAAGHHKSLPDNNLISSTTSTLAPPSLCVELDAATVTDTFTSTTWWDTSTVLVWDDLISDDLRQRLLAVVKGGDGDNADWDDEQGPDPNRWTRGGLIDTPRDGEDDEGQVTTMTPEQALCWGLGDDVIDELCNGNHLAILEFEKILAEQMFPQFIVSRLPEAVFGACVSPLTANAPTHGDHFNYHIDGDPNLTPPSPWTDVYGRYPNRQAGKPRFVSCLVYLNKEWKWGAPTRFLDLPTSLAYDVSPRPGRCVILDQDVSHTVVAPDVDAGLRPRYSLVWKLILHPRHEHQDMSDLRNGRENWPEPILFGSAAREEQ